MFCEVCGTLKSMGICQKCSRPKPVDQGTASPKQPSREKHDKNTCIRCGKAIPKNSQYTYCFVCRGSSVSLIDKKREEEYDQEKESKEDGYQE